MSVIAQSAGPAERRSCAREEGPAPVHELFEIQARRAPRATALVFKDRSLSYAELDDRAGGFAEQLTELGVGPDDLNIATLAGRVAGGGVGEVILAVNATVEGQTTAHYITDRLAGLGAKVTRLAHGVPVGGELDYLDEGTLAAAVRQRTAF